MVLSLLIKLLGVVCVTLLIVNIVFLIKYGKPFITFQLPGVDEITGDGEEEEEEGGEGESELKGKLHLVESKPSIFIE